MDNVYEVVEKCWVILSSSGEDLIFFWGVVIVRADHLELMGD